MGPPSGKIHPLGVFFFHRKAEKASEKGAEAQGITSQKWWIWVCNGWSWNMEVSQLQSIAFGVVFFEPRGSNREPVLPITCPGGSLTSEKPILGVLISIHVRPHAGDWLKGKQLRYVSAPLGPSGFEEAPLQVVGGTLSERKRQLISVPKACCF